LPLDAQFKILQGVMKNMYGERVSVAYRQYSRVEDGKLRRKVLPLPAVVIDGEVVLRGQLHIQIIVSRLAEIGLTPHLSEKRKRKT